MQVFNRNAPTRETWTTINIGTEYVKAVGSGFGLGDIFGIGPLVPNTAQTNYDVEQRSFNASLYHDFTPSIQAGGYVSIANSSSYRGQRDRDIPIDSLFSGDHNTVPVA